MKEIILDLEARFRVIASDATVKQTKSPTEIVVHVNGYFTAEEISEVAITMFRHGLVASCEDTFDGENGLILWKNL